MTIRDQLIGSAMSAGWTVAEKLPEPLSDALFRTAGKLLYHRQGAGVRQLATNYRRVLGAAATSETLAATVRAGVLSYARYWKETCRLGGLDPEAVYRRALADTVGMEGIERARSQGRGVIVALPHSGNWDIAGLMVSRHLGGITTVVERLGQDWMFRKFVGYRESLGMEVLPLTGGDAPASAVLKDRLRAGRIVCLIADRDLTRSGVPVNFFGEEARMPAGPAMLAALTGAELRTARLNFTPADGSTPEGWQQVIGAPIELPGKRLRDQVSAGTQLIADEFAGYIAERPADWHMMQPFWLADLPAARRRELTDATSTAGQPR